MLVTIKKKQILKGLSLDVEKGELVSLLGPSGCRKSTLLSMIASLMEPRKRYHLHPWSSASMSRQRIGYMLQKDHLFEWRTIYKNVILGLEIQNRMTEKNLEHVEQLLRDYGLDQFRNASLRTVRRYAAAGSTYSHACFESGPSAP